MLNKKDQEKSTRQFNIASIINHCPHVFTCEMLAERFNCSKETVQRDIAFICQIGIVIETRPEKQGYSMPTDLLKALRKINETNREGGAIVPKPTRPHDKRILSENQKKHVPIRALPACSCSGNILIFTYHYGSGEHLWLECGNCLKQGYQAIPKNLTSLPSPSR